MWGTVTRGQVRQVWHVLSRMVCYVGARLGRRVVSGCVVYWCGDVRFGKVRQAWLGRAVLGKFRSVMVGQAW